MRTIIIIITPIYSNQIIKKQQSKLQMKISKTSKFMQAAHNAHSNAQLEKDSDLRPMNKGYRLRRIKDKNYVYPQSTKDKIVFISNQYGTGFRKQPLQIYQIPSHIPISLMLQQINEACMQEQSQHTKKKHQNPIDPLQNLLLISSISIIIFTITYIGFFHQIQPKYYYIFNYIMLGCVGLIFLFLLGSLCLRIQKEDRLDVRIIQAVLAKLSQFNRIQEQKYGGLPRFKWTCHRDCLWIALSF